MASSRASLINLIDLENKASPVPSQFTVVNAFGMLMALAASKRPSMLRDRCSRLPTTYNNFYDPNKPANESNKANYSPYAFGEPLFDDRPVKLDRLPAGHTIAGASKRKRVQWVWKLGYALVNNSKASKPIIWCCHHNAEFSKNRDFHFNANTLSNAQKHLAETHYLEEGGDI
ncbi:hypothetical protein IFR05_016025 [Cadophora sp. M221]|nr:hypothetical protein IFR05_016025 [Cadophora sp. M221]